jgi:hypothetical protein
MAYSTGRTLRPTTPLTLLPVTIRPQALFTLMEKDVKILCRAKDSALVNQAKDEAKKEFEEQAGFEIKLTVAEELPEGS